MIVLTGTAVAVENTKADQIFEKMEQNPGLEREEIEAQFIQLKKLIASNDIERKVRFEVMKCWDQHPRTSEQMTQAIAFADHWLHHDNSALFPKSHLNFLLCKSFMQEQNSDTVAAMAGYNQAIKDAYRLEDNRLIADARSLRGELHSFQGDFAAALEDLITAQHLYENSGLKYWAIYNLGSIAVSYRRFGDPQNAIRYFTQQAQAYTQLNHLEEAQLIDTEIGFALEELGEYQQALAKHLNVYQYYKSQQKVTEAARIAVNVGAALIKLNRYTEALNYLNEALVVITPGSVGVYSYLNFNLAEVFVEKKQFDKAAQFNQVAELAFEKNGNLRGLQHSLALKSKIFAQRALWQQAYTAQQEMLKVHDQLDGKLQSRRTAEIRGRFNADKMEAENKRLQEYKQLKENEQTITEQNRILQLTVLILALIIIVILAVFIFKQVRRAKMLEALALTDHLTQLPNRRHIYVRGERDFNTAKEQQNDFSIILFDADNFKQVNDKFGHDVGDNVLVTLAESSATLMRKGDVVGRIGGEEFLILLRETPAKQAMNIADRLVNSIANQNLDHIKPGLNIEISAGVASLRHHKDFSELFSCADKALYRAKENGRNRVEQAD